MACELLSNPQAPHVSLGNRALVVLVLKFIHSVAMFLHSAWPVGKVLRIKFLGKHDLWMDAIQKYAPEWTVNCNLYLFFLPVELQGGDQPQKTDGDDADKCHILISFDEKQPTSSLRGKQSLRKSEGSTMNFQPADYKEKQARDTILRVFATALDLDDLVRGVEEITPQIMQQAREVYPPRLVPSLGKYRK